MNTLLNRPEPGLKLHPSRTCTHCGEDLPQERAHFWDHVTRCSQCGQRVHRGCQAKH